MPAATGSASASSSASTSSGHAPSVDHQATFDQHMAPQLREHLQNRSQPNHEPTPNVSRWALLAEERGKVDWICAKPNPSPHSYPGPNPNPRTLTLTLP